MENGKWKRRRPLVRSDAVDLRGELAERDEVGMVRLIAWDGRVFVVERLVVHVHVGADTDQLPDAAQVFEQSATGIAAG